MKTEEEKVRPGEKGVGREKKPAIDDRRSKIRKQR